MRKLLIFDSWTKGSIHIIRMLADLRAVGVEPVFVHLGSWGDDPGRPARETIEGLDVRDISGYRDLPSVLAVEKPDAVLFLSLDSFLHRAFNRYCHQAGVTTMNLYPGLWSAQAYDTPASDHGDAIGYVRWAASRLGRFGRHVFPQYMISLARTRAAFAEWRAFLGEVAGKLTGRGSFEAPDDARTDYICVHNVHDADHARRKYGHNAGRITTVGVPDFMKFRGLEERLGKYLNDASHARDVAVYIGTGVRSTRMKVADDDVYLAHLLDTQRALASEGKRMVCKLHYSRVPRMRELASATSEGLTLCEDDDFIETLAESCGAIVEPSTAALAAIVMGKPVFLAQYGRLAGLPHGAMLSGYPRAVPVRSVEELSAVSRPAPVPSIDLAMDWIQGVAGPLPAARMPERVAAVVAEATRAMR